jgi:tetratricopeptide (TPR) repeat protein
MSYGELLSTKLCTEGRYEEALAATEAELAHDPEEPEAFFNRGQALACLDRLEAAAAAYEQALTMDAGASALDPETVDDELFFVLRRQAERLSGDPGAAATALRRYLAILPAGRHVADVPKWVDKLRGVEPVWVREEA